jgi:integrase
LDPKRTTAHARRFKRTADADERNLRLHVLPVWGERAYTSITRSDVIELVEGLVAGGTGPLANRVQSLISKIFSFAVDVALLEANPATRLRMRANDNALMRVLDDGEIRLFWAQIMSPPLLPATGIALRLALLTGLRASEIAGIHHTEITNIHDPEQAAILIPEARVKNKRDFLVPLSPLARQLVLEAQQLAGDGAEYLFPSRHDKGAALDPPRWRRRRRASPKIWRMMTTRKSRLAPRHGRPIHRHRTISGAPSRQGCRHLVSHEKIAWRA